VRHRLRSGDRRGQALVEFAIVLPALLLLLMGIVDMARAWNIYEVITDAGREGARRAVVDSNIGTEDEVKDVIVAAGRRAAVSIDPNRITITNFQAGRGTEALVRVEYDHTLQWVGALLALATGDRVVTLTSEFAMRNE
jgi:Flp pilus assembly protein TadG